MFQCNERLQRVSLYGLLSRCGPLRAQLGIAPQRDQLSPSLQDLILYELAIRPSWRWLKWQCVSERLQLTVSLCLDFETDHSRTPSLQERLASSPRALLSHWLGVGAISASAHLVCVHVASLGCISAVAFRARCRCDAAPLRCKYLQHCTRVSASAQAQHKAAQKAAHTRHPLHMRAGLCRCSAQHRASARAGPAGLPLL